MNKNKIEIILGYALGFLIVAIISLAINWLVVALWNWLVPAIFHGPELSFWQMYGLTVLLNLILNIFRRRRD